MTGTVSGDGTVVSAVTESAVNGDVIDGGKVVVEIKRGCGFRKIGGIYIVGGVSGLECPNIPYKVCNCPVCGGGVKQSRGFTWIRPNRLFDAPETSDCANLGIEVEITYHDGSKEKSRNCNKTGKICPFFNSGAHGLMWVGTRFYPTPKDFADEAAAMGVSKRISQIPRNFKAGRTWMYVAHPKVFEVDEKNPDTNLTEKVWKAGVFLIFKPERIEMLITETQSKDVDLLKDLKKRGITPVIVADSATQHTGTVYDAKKKPALVLDPDAAIEGENVEDDDTDDPSKEPVNPAPTGA